MFIYISHDEIDAILECKRRWKYIENLGMHFRHMIPMATPCIMIHRVDIFYIDAIQPNVLTRDLVF